MIGDVVGKAGEKSLQEKLPEFKKEAHIDFIIVNAENIDSSGSGIRPESLKNMLSWGVDVVTGGDHQEKNIDKDGFIIDGDRLLRPLNYSKYAGKGSLLTVLEGHENIEIAVINLLGNVYMEKTESAFHLVEREIQKIAPFTRIIFVDFHAEATSEKIAMGWHLDGKVSAVVGTHTHVQTADECILPKGTAYITDLGMTGGHDGVIGRQKENVLRKFLHQPHSKFQVATKDVRLNGVLIDVDIHSGKSLKIERVSLAC